MIRVSEFAFENTRHREPAGLSMPVRCGRERFLFAVGPIKTKREREPCRDRCVCEPIV